MLLKQTSGFTTPVVKLDGIVISDAVMRKALIESEDFTPKAVKIMSAEDVKTNYNVLIETE
jgi:hypothetical protein